MNKRFKNVWHAVQHPPTFVKVITFLTCLISASASLVLIAVGTDSALIEVLSYVLFAVAGVSLAYTVILLIPIVPHVKDYAVAWMNKRPFTRKLMANFGFRTIVFAVGSFSLSVVFSAFNAYMGVKNKSIWYGALAAYYIALAVMRGGILLSHRRSGGNSENGVFLFRRCGIVLLVLNVAISSAIAQMIFSGAHFSYVGLTIFAYAAYAFYKITMAIINLIRSKKVTDYTVKSVLCINLADATMSIMALQTALLITFSDETMNVSLMNTFTGIAVSALTIGLGIIMIATANKKIKLLREEK